MFWIGKASGILQLHGIQAATGSPVAQASEQLRKHFACIGVVINH
jgi:hypothetical protein